MSLITKPIIHDSYIEYQHRGEFRNKGNTQPYTSWPETISPRFSDRMVDIAISNWTLNSFTDAIHDSHRLNYTYTVDDLDDKRKHLLNTTCLDDCFGKLFPAVSTLYPNEVVELKVTGLKQSRVEIDPQEFKIIINFDFEAYVRTSDDSVKELFSVGIDLIANVRGTVKGSRLAFEMERPVNSTFTVFSSKIGYLTKENVISVFQQALQKNAISLLTFLKTKGFKMTSILNFTITDTKYVKTDDAFWFMMNLTK